MIPFTVPNPFDTPVDGEVLCDIASAWGLDPDLVARIVKARGALPFDLWIFSGKRSRAEQNALTEQGRPTADFDRSTHADVDARGCPRLATGADVQPVSPGVRVSRAMTHLFGLEMFRQGLRWGGGSPVDPVTGLPSDKWHVDLGARKN